MGKPKVRTLRRSAPPTPQSRNRILAALPRVDFERLRSALSVVTLEQKHSLWEPGQPIEVVYFPLDFVASILAVTKEGLQVEVGTVGNEGLVGLPVFLGAKTSPGRAFVQVPGQGERLDVSVFLREALREGKLRDILHRYTLSFMTQVSQSFACNRAHPAPQRLARWLLVVRDRVGRNEFPLTHQFMGQMLAVRRATVTVTAGALQRARLISYRRGVITIRDGPGLEQIACECYWIVREEFERLLGSPTR
jgi:CRP-like cAMP-binding protein